MAGPGPWRAVSLRHGGWREVGESEKASIQMDILQSMLLGLRGSDGSPQGEIVALEKWPGRHPDDEHARVPVRSQEGATSSSMEAAMRAVASVGEN